MYWAERQAKAQEKLTTKKTKETEAQVRQYYETTMKKVLNDFEKTYDKLLETVLEGHKPTPADLFKLDKYWQMQRQVRQELQKLGDEEIEALGKSFEEHFWEIYNSIALKSQKAFATIDEEGVKHLLNAIWCADGKTWSQRVWENTTLLQNTLNEALVECVVAGKKTSELKKQLQNRFGVSYHRAETLTRTELAHIQTQAAAQRYKDSGLTQYEILGNDDDSCGGSKVDCHKMNGKRFYYSQMVEGKNAPPFHPNCRCCIIPVVE